MPMQDKGIPKLMEECAEVVQVCSEVSQRCAALIQTCGKKLACMDSDAHWDGKGSLKTRLEEELGDAWAAMEFLSKKLELNQGAIQLRGDYKLSLYESWDVQANDAPKPDPVQTTHHHV